MSAIADFFARLSLRPDKASFDAGEKLLGTVKTALVGLAAYKTVGFFAGMIEEVTRAGGHLDDLSKQTGINTDSLQELGYAAKLSGIDMDTLVGGLGKLGVGLQGAITTGTGPAADALKSLGISVGQVKGKMSGPGGFDDVLGIIADKIAKMPAGIAKSNAAIGLFGRSGKELIPLLDEGAGGIDKMRERANELGLVMNQDAVKALAGFDDQLDETQMMLHGLKQDIVVALLPTIKGLITEFGEWFRANRKLIGQKIATVVRGIAAAISFLAGIVGKVVDVVIWFGDNLGILVAILGGLTAAMLILGNESVIAALESAVAWAAAALPLILMATIVAAAILIIQDLYTWLDGGDSVFKRLYESIKDWLGEKTMQVINGLIHGFNKVIEAAEVVANTVNNAMQKGRSFVKEALRSTSASEGEAETAAKISTARVAGTSFAKTEADQAKFYQEQLEKEREARGLPTDAELDGPINKIKFARIADLKTEGASGIGANITTDPEQYDTPAARAARAAQMFQRGQMAGVPQSVLVPNASNSNSFAANATITVNAGAGADGGNIARSLKGALDDWFDDIKRQAHPGNGKP